MRRRIRLTESELRRMISESVKRVLNEIGDTSDGQRKLGALQSRQFMRDDREDSDNTWHYAEKARGGDFYDNLGNNTNPMFKDYANGYLDYMNSHPDEYFAHQRRHSY